jgi:hypothetical protein
MGNILMMRLHTQLPKKSLPPLIRREIRSIHACNPRATNTEKLNKTYQGLAKKWQMNSKNVLCLDASRD